MGPHVPEPVPTAKGSICYCLDEFSKGSGARRRIAKLREAIAELRPSYAGLAEVFDEHMVSYVIESAGARQRIVEYLNAYWFDPASSVAYFPGTPVSKIYAEGVVKALDLSLHGSRGAIPINAWWVQDSTRFRLLSLTDVEDGVTIGGNVTLLVLTPRPKVKRRTATTVSPWILGDVAEAYVTEQQKRKVVTKRVRDMT
jgi:hypothetical protein